MTDNADALEILAKQYDNQADIIDGAILAVERAEPLPDCKAHWANVKLGAATATGMKMLLSAQAEQYRERVETSGGARDTAEAVRLAAQDAAASVRQAALDAAKAIQVARRETKKPWWRLLLSPNALWALAIIIVVLALTDNLGTVVKWFANR